MLMAKYPARQESVDLRINNLRITKMLDYIINIFREIFGLLNEMSPYLLLGFLVAGLLHAFVPSSLSRRYLAANDFRSVLWAAIIGVPLPLCSCGVIPTAMSLRKEGASKGAVTSFLIATPQTGVDSILATAALMGIPFAIIRPVAALLTALAGGQLVNVAEQRQPKEAVADTNIQEEKANKTLTNRVIEALRYGFVDMVQDIGKWLVIGLVVAGFITVLVPDGFFLRFADTPLLSMLVVLLISIPMYVCATGSIPIAVALMLKGISPGAALVLLMAGPASNMASILVINKVLGKRTLLMYLISITLGAVGFGLIIDYLLPTQWFMSQIVEAQTCCHDTPAVFNMFCSGVLICLLLYALISRLVHKEDNCACHCKDDNCLKTNDMNTYKIEGMMCNHCRANVEKTLKGLEGATEVSVDLASGRAVVEGDVSAESVIKAIENMGYKVEKLD